MAHVSSPKHSISSPSHDIGSQHGNHLGNLCNTLPVNNMRWPVLGIMMNLVLQANHIQNGTIKLISLT